MVWQPPFDPAPGSALERTRFTELQARLADRFRRFARDPGQPYTAVVIPSQSFDPRELAKISGVAHYEERSLFNLMLLRHPRLHVVYVTSKRIDPLIIDYYLHQMRGVPSAHARRRLHLLDCDDGSARPLTQKILERPQLRQRIAEAIADPDMAHMVVFNASALERTLSVQLSIPLNACDPSLIDLGHKSGARRVFEEAGLQPAPGAHDLRDVDDLVAAIERLWADTPDVRRVVVKLDDSFSGEGNAVLDLSRVDGTGSAADRMAKIRAALPSLRFEAAGLTWDEYEAQFAAMGGICEQWIEGEGKTSPSVQMRINPLRDIQVISTHDQVLGGPSGQIFEGASFPADAAYRLEIQALGRRVAEQLAQHGVIGRFGVDFLVVPSSGAGAPPRIVPIEINLRQGGTTHPFTTLKFLTDGQFDEAEGVFRTAQGSTRSYFATDTLVDPDYRGLLPFDLIDRMVAEGIHFRSDETGVVFHLLGCLSELGKLGCTAIAPTVTEARARYDAAVRSLDRLCKPPT